MHYSHRQDNETKKWPFALISICSDEKRQRPQCSCLMFKTLLLTVVLNTIRHLPTFGIKNTTLRYYYQLCGTLCYLAVRYFSTTMCRVHGPIGICWACHVRIQRGGGGTGPDPPPPLKNHKNIGFLGNTGQDPLKIWIVGPSSFKWRFAGGHMMVLFGSSALIIKKTCQSWTPSGKTSWIRTCLSRYILYRNYLKACFIFKVRQTNMLFWPNRRTGDSD